MYIFKWLDGKHRAMVPRYGVPGRGKHRVWKTQGLVEIQGLSEKHREPFLHQNMNFPHENEKSKFCYFKLQ